MRWFVVGLAGVLSCAPSTTPAVDFFPLEVGAFWVYDVALNGQAPVAERQVLVSDAMGDGARREYVVSELDESLAPEDRTDHPTTYQRGAEGVRCLECESLHVPSSPVEGQTWPASTPEGGRSRVVATGASFAKGPLQFSHCLVIERVEPVRKRRIEFTFAPGVGLVRTRFFAEATDSSTALREEVLSEYGKILPARFPRPPR